MVNITRLLNRESMLLMKRWLEYIPEFWDFEQILAKETKKLTETELQRIRIAKQEQEMCMLLNKLLELFPEPNCWATLSWEDNLKLNKIIEYYDLDKIAFNKIEEGVLNKLFDLIEQYDGTNFIPLLEKSKEFNNEFAKEYIRYRLESKKIELRVNNLRKNLLYRASKEK